MTPSEPYTDPTTGQWVGEYETQEPDGQVRRQTEWFDTRAQAQAFARSGTIANTAPGGSSIPAQVTHQWCPASGAPEGSDGSTHHLVPRSAGQGAAQMVCSHCGKTELELREQPAQGTNP